MFILLALLIVGFIKKSSAIISIETTKPVRLPVKKIQNKHTKL